MTEKKAVIITAIPCEYAAVRKRLENRIEDTHPSGSVYEKGTFAGWSVLIAEIGAGNERAAAETQRAVEYFSPHVVFFVGIAGGVKDVVLGDVVCATKVYGYESGKDKAEFLTRPNVQNSADVLINRARAEGRNADWFAGVDTKVANGSIQPRVLVAPIAAGSKVVASTRSATAKFLKVSYSDSVAVEMEGIGFLTAASMTQSCFAMVIRGISDLIDKKASSDNDGWQEIAAEHAAAFAFRMLSQIESKLLLHP
jgi:nucleoside phosphorylase